MLSNWTEYDGDPAAWDGLAADGRLPLQQSWAYGEAMRGYGARPLRLVCHRRDATIASAQLMRSRLLGFLKPVACFRGPMWADENAAAGGPEPLTSLRRMFPKRQLEFLMVMPEEAAGPGVQARMRRAGFRRIMTGYSTIWIDLSQDIDLLRRSMDGKWRNALVRAEGAGLEVGVGGRRAHQYQWLLEREGAQREAVRYAGLPTGLVERFADASAAGGGQGVLSLTAIKGRDKVAGALILLHGNSATYFIGWNGEQGRGLSAHNLLLWRAIGVLQERGMRWLDLGGVNTAHGAGIARFKLGMGAQPLTLAGSYL